ncbi:uncharacterized protein IAS62_005984 [Cryptococcus decagattii]|uniref:Secreted protein n=1 Tax=Cryptococcus decagattii TaxID=1859122 RepID=A0ABZ2B584_9TREE
MEKVSNHASLCLLPPLIPVVAMLCTDPEQHQEQHRLLLGRPFPPGHCLLHPHTAPHLRPHSNYAFFNHTATNPSPFSAVPYLIHPIAQSSPNNCFLYRVFSLAHSCNRNS